jgi:hypothetical protein
VITDAMCELAHGVSMVSVALTSNPGLPFRRRRLSPAAAVPRGSRAPIAVLAAALGMVAAGCGGGGNATTTQQSATKTFVALADTYVRASDSRTNFGKNTEVRVDGSPQARAYIQFQPFGVDGKIKHATLRLRSLSTSSDGFQVRGVRGPWSESGTTFANAPQVGQIINLSGPLGKDRWVSIDITPLVRPRATSVQVALVALGPTELALASRETPRFAPQLIVESGG